VEIVHNCFKLSFDIHIRNKQQHSSISFDDIERDARFRFEEPHNASRNKDSFDN
jgi:hypothetical protein